MSLNDVFTSTPTVILRDGDCQNLSFQNIFGENTGAGKPGNRGTGEPGNRRTGETGKGETGNRVNGEHGNRGIREQGNRGIGEQGNRGTKKQRNATFCNTAVKRLRMCELSFELRFFFRTYKGALKLFRCFLDKK